MRKAKTQCLTTGRRKESVARVQIVPGKGKMSINGRPLSDYVRRESLEMIIKQPLLLTSTINKFDIIANVDGGGISGQAGALRLGIARALAELDESLRPVLRRAGMLTRDPRMKERKKYGQRGARARFQYSKR